MRSRRSAFVSALSSMQMTWAPSRANISAVARPRPQASPAITTVFPLKLIVVPFVHGVSIYETDTLPARKIGQCVRRPRVSPGPSGSAPGEVLLRSGAWNRLPEATFLDCILEVPSCRKSVVSPHLKQVRCVSPSSTSCGTAISTTTPTRAWPSWSLDKREGKRPHCCGSTVSIWSAAMCTAPRA